MKKHIRSGNIVLVLVAKQWKQGFVVKIEGTSVIVCVEGEGVNDRRYDISEIRQYHKKGN